ncbi:MAG TPA: YqhV family protein [Bacillota bacterium]
MGPLNPFVGGMVLVRILSASIELTAALLMARANQIETALRINGFLGLVGPTVLIVVSIIGLVGVADHLSPVKTLLILAGVLLILLGTR